MTNRVPVNYAPCPTRALLATVALNPETTARQAYPMCLATRDLHRIASHVETWRTLNPLQFISFHHLHRGISHRGTGHNRILLQSQSMAKWVRGTRGCGSVRHLLRRSSSRQVCRQVTCAPFRRIQLPPQLPLSFLCCRRRLLRRLCRKGCVRSACQQVAAPQ